MRELRQPGRSVHSWGQHSVGGGRCGVSPSSSEPEGGTGAEAVSPAARDPTSTVGSPSCVPRSLPHSGEKPPDTEKLRFGVGSPSDLHFPFNLTQCGDWLLVRHWSKDMCLSFSQLISMLKMFSLDTVLAVITVYKAGQNPKARLVVSRGHGSGCSRVAGSPEACLGHTRTAVPPVLRLRSEWPRAGDPARDPPELLLRLLSSRQPRPRCPFLLAVRGGFRGRQG